ncbi:MAG: hypothetical protein DME18_00385 [Verrucomicrobia bacterium]|nr:MAG: hypothetical protein DME18_00385 [Verrucomicrobiota bacterium]
MFVVPIRVGWSSAVFKEHPMSAREDLSHLLSELEGQAVRVSFVDGEMYDLEIKSASRTRDNGTFDTTVIWAIRCLNATNIETGVEMTFRLDDVARIQILKDARCVFDRGGGPG